MAKSWHQVINIFSSKNEFKSRPLHFLTIFTGEKRYFLKKCPLLHFTGKIEQISFHALELKAYFLPKVI